MSGMRVRARCHDPIDADRVRFGLQTPKPDTWIKFYWAAWLERKHARMSTGYDSRCLDLAEIFLEGEPEVTKAEAEELAQAIQDTIETWLNNRQVEPP